MDQKLLTLVKDYELRNFIVDFRPYLVARTVNPHQLATCMGADQYLINLVLEPLDTYNKNERAYDYISGKNDWARFLMALKESGNGHIESFVIQEINKRQHISSSNGNIPFNYGGTGLPTNTNTTTHTNTSMNTLPYQNFHPNTNIHPHHPHTHPQQAFGNVSPSQYPFGVGIPTHLPQATTNSAFGWTQNTHTNSPTVNCPYPVQGQGAFLAVCPPVSSAPMPVNMHMNSNNMFNPGTGVNIPPTYPPSANFSSQPLHLPSHQSQHNSSAHNFPQPSAPSLNNINGPPQTNIWNQGQFQPRHY